MHRKLCVTHLRVVTIALFLAALTWSGAQAQDKAKPPSASQGLEEKARVDEEWSLEKLKAKRAEVETSTTLSDPVKKSTLTYLDQAIRFREELDQIKRDAEDFAQKIKGAPDRIKEIEAELKRPAPPSESDKELAAARKMDTDKLEQRVQEEGAGLVEAKANLTKLNDQLEKEKAGPKQLAERITKAKQKLKEVKAAMDSPPQPGGPAPVTEARRVSLLSEQAKYRALIKAEEQRQPGNEVFMSLLKAERDLADLQVKRHEKLINALKEEAQKRRQREAVKAVVGAEEAKTEAARLPEPLQKEFDFNVKLAEELDKVTSEQADVTRTLEQKKAQLKAIEEEFTLARERVKISMRKEVVGLALREQRRSLPSFQGYSRESGQRQMKMSQIQGAQLEVERRVRDLSDIDAETTRIIQLLGAIPDDQAASLKDKVTKLLSDRRDLLQKLGAEYQRYFKQVQNLEYTDQQLVELASEFKEFLDLKLMWIRSSKVFGPKDFKNLPTSVGWILNPFHWWQLLQDSWKSFKRTPVLWTMAWLFGLALILGRRRARRDLERVARRVKHVKTDSFLLTIRALALTAYLAVGWPFLIGLVSRQLSALPNPQNFTVAASKGFGAVAWSLALYGFFYYLCANHGLAQVHFRWSEAVRLSLQRNLWWLIRWIIPIAFLVRAERTVEYGDSLGRLAFMAITVGLSAVVARIFRFSGPIVSALIRNRPDDWLVRLRYVWYPLAVGLPLLMATLAALGYYYFTAFALAKRVLSTYQLILVLAIVHSLFLRWLSIAKRRFAYEEAEREREEEEAAREQQTDEQATELGIEGRPAIEEQKEITIDEIDDQTRNLLRVVVLFSLIIGLWAIWEQVLSAFQTVLDIQLWSSSAVVEGVTRQVPITLANLVTGVVISLITFVAAKNLPGVLEITILKRLSMDKGARYAFTTVCRYVITAIGVVIAFSTIGFKWSQLQWLIAALSVGIGFGLQEIVANFISGIIILFERPIRVGDIVTVDNTTGKVSRIRIRATTITDWDRKDYVVPNKEFVTGRVLNWTLTNKVNRIVITVGVAYGSDTELTRELLLKVANEHPRVLDDPGPLATFDEFGDNALNFTLRCYLPSMDKRLATVNELHMAIDKALREAGITIAFPQRDVHIDTLGPLDVHVVQEKQTRAKASKKGKGESQT
jgi:potassium efflux system protein